MTGCLQRMLDATAALDARVVVDHGAAVDPSRLRRRPTTRSTVRPARRADARVSLVVGHGGHGTTMQALAHDLPLV
jgi:UDP:flavonoid glycosyltransferase YjiC (YdhE family)